MKYKNISVVAYDTFDNNIVVYECATTREMAQYFNCSINTIQDNLHSGSLYQRRYSLVRVNLDKGENI